LTKRIVAIFKLLQLRRGAFILLQDANVVPERQKSARIGRFFKK